MQDIEIRDPLEHLRACHFFRIGIVDAIDARRFQNYLRLDLHRAQSRRRVRGKVGIAGTRRKDHHALLLEVPRRAPPDEGLGHLMHFDRAHHARVAACFFERVLQREAIEHRREHAHVVARRAIDLESLLPRTAKNVAAADDHRDFDAEILNVFYFARDALDCFRVNSKIIGAGKRFARKLQDDALVDRRFPGHAFGACLLWCSLHRVG